jgi:hypothetical protein
LFTSIELPGGLKVAFRDLEQAKQEAESAGLLAKPLAAAVQDQASSYPLALLQTLDPNLALAGLRIEIEKRLVELGRKHGIESTRYGIKWLLSTLTLLRVLTPEEEIVLERLTKLMNSAVHGAEVDPRGSAWATQVGPAILEALDRKIGEGERPQAGA